jgi:hypothetical protein
MDHGVCVVATILFLSANPSGTTALELDEEVRAVDDERVRAPLRDAFDLRPALAARIDDVRRKLAEHRPAVVHFASHARASAITPAGAPGRDLLPADDPTPALVRGELVLLDEAGRAAPVPIEALAEVFRLGGRGVRCVVLNACETLAQAEAITAHLDGAVVGTTQAVPDRVAIAFSMGFYGTLCSGGSLREAFDEGRNNVRARGAGDPAAFELRWREGVRPEEIWLAEAREERAPFRVPFLRNPGFVGRDDDLARLHDLLQKGGAVGVRPAALTGMGGIGKTQLAVEYVYRYRGEHPGGVYWVNAAEPLQAEFARLAIEVRLGAEDAPEAERQRRLALAFAGYLEARPDALAVFDNVEDPLALRSPGPGFVPEQLGCLLLFTTRRRDPDSPFETVDVRVLPEDIALRLLLSGGARRALLDGGPAAEINAARVICASLGCLPLALVLAAAFLARYPRIALGEYLARIRKEGALVAADAAKVDRRKLGTLHDAAVGATLRTQWDAIAGEDAKLVLKAATLLGAAALVPRARLALLTGLADEAQPGYPAPLEEALRELGGLSLVEELTEREIRLHPLVREFAEKQIEERGVFAAECGERVGEALWDMGRLHEEVAGRGIDAVLGDLRVGSRLAGASGQGQLETLIRPLDRESHALRRWDAAEEPGFFLQQLRNQCFEMGSEEMRERAETKLEEHGWPSLRERIPTSRESGALIRTLAGHTDFVNGVALTPDGRLAVSASSDRTLRVWNLATGQAIRTLEGHSKGVTCVVITPDGRFAISASYDARLKIWDLETGQVIRTLEGHSKGVTSVTVTSDGRLAISTSQDETLRVWNLETGKVVQIFKGHSSRANCWL